MCAALASCVGSGNIIGVSTALVSGGIGAIFWMWVAAFLGMATKYGEIILGIIYREKNGGFKKIEEIKSVDGIGEKTFEKIKEFIKL